MAGNLFILNEVLSITAQEFTLAGQWSNIGHFLNEVLSITAQEFEAFRGPCAVVGSSMKS